MNLLDNFFRYYSSSNPVSGVKNFSIVHFSWLFVAIAILVIFIKTYQKLCIETRQTVMKVCVVFLMVIYLERSLWATLLGHFSMDSMLPLHLCGAMVFIEFYAVFSDNKLMKEFVYCAGLPGASLALITPELNGYPLFSFQYQVFILSHLILMLIPLLWVFGENFIPDRKYVMKAYSILCVMAIFNGFVNKLLNSNYMFVSKAPDSTPFFLIEVKYGYFAYLIFLLIFTLFIMNVMYLPWKNRIPEIE